VSGVYQEAYRSANGRWWVMSYEIQPLVEAYGRPWREFRATVRTNFAVLNRYKAEGMPFYVADRFAVLCDLHPVEVWGYEAWIEGAETNA